MENNLLKNTVLIVMSLACLACVFGLGFVLFDMTRITTRSTTNAYGVVAVFVMVVAMAVRWVWHKRRRD